MRPPLKLSEIDREHLQELYDAAGVARDQLPYTAKYDEIWQGFQDRTFKNAEREQIFGALLKYTRTGTKTPAPLPDSQLTPDQLKQLKGLLNRHAKGGKVLPYSDEFARAKEEFTKLSGTTLDDAAFWLAVLHATGAKRKPPVRTKAKAEPAESEDDGGDE
jgi:hypothetical protein